MALTGLLLVNNLLSEIILVFLALPIAGTVAIAYVSAPNTITISFITNDNGNATIPALTSRVEAGE